MTYKTIKNLPHFKKKHIQMQFVPYQNITQALFTAT